MRFTQAKTVLCIALLGAVISCSKAEKKKSSILIPLALTGTENTFRSESSFVENSANTRAPMLGPDTASADLNDTASLSDPELLKNIQSNILDGDTDVEVNLPVTVTLLSGYSSAGSSIQNSYIADSSGKKLYTRLTVSVNKITLIPQIRLQPGKSYTAVIGGVLSPEGKNFGNIKIHYKNTDLDYGLYWYGKNGVCEKYFPGVPNSFYNPSAKTVVFSHGWQNNSVGGTDAYGRSGFRYEMFYWSENNFKGSPELNGIQKFTNHSWIDKGWNTGITYWNQFADDDLFGAEGKIWNLTAGPQGSRYRTMDSSGTVIYKNWDRKVKINGLDKEVNSVGEMLSLFVVDALKSNTSGNIRLVGHSLGNQVITNIADYVNKAGIKINRIALLDPAWTDGAKSYLPKVTQEDMNIQLNHNGAKALDAGSLGTNFWLVEYSRKILYTIMNRHWSTGIAVERYNSTPLNLYLPVMDENDRLSKQIAVMDVKPWYYSADQLGPKHISIRHHYFWSMESEAPAECTVFLSIRKKTGNIAGSASTPDARIHEMMTTGYYYSQVEGRYTADPSDDWFEKKIKL
ncbi:MAG TPA: hypothetical protein PL048_05180 [Leptospiraceae bacterium]|nr:hypothetical protein [Leptospiraceae bacterium]